MKTLTNRQAFSEMWEELHKEMNSEETSTVIVDNLSRIARDTKELNYFGKELMSYDGRFISIKDNYDVASGIALHAQYLD